MLDLEIRVQTPGIGSESEQVCRAFNGGLLNQGDLGSNVHTTMKVTGQLGPVTISQSYGREINWGGER